MYDVKCEDLARAFLPDDSSEDRVKRLAQHIQDEIEYWLQLEGIEAK